MTGCARAPLRHEADRVTTPVLALAVAALGGTAHGEIPAGPPGDAEILALVRAHCIQCHAAAPTHEAFARPPKGITLESVEEISRNGRNILIQVVTNRAMPLGNQTGMTDAERDRLAAWIESRK